MNQQNLKDLKLNELPSDMQNEIMNYLSLKDVNNLRLSSKSLSNPDIFKNYINTHLKYQNINIKFYDISEAEEHPLISKCKIYNMFNLNFEK